MKIRGSSIIIFLTLSLFIMFFTVSCKKYPDGPFFNFTSKYNRLEKAYWVLDYLEIGGIDSTSDFLAASDSGYVFESMKFFEPDKGISAINYKSPSHQSAIYFTWGFADRKGNWQFKLHLIQDPFLRKAILLDLYGLMRELNIEL
ncbi:MAG: hypothetical protein IPP32_14445 [Bacteroidetes bacterium]|nr:hypothetical protein [Bacteroidota bacterium]